MRDDIEELMGAAVSEVFGAMLNYKVETAPVNVEAMSDGTDGETVALAA